MQDTLADELEDLRLQYQEVVVHWIPENCGLAGNEIAHRLAKKEHCSP